MRHIPSQQARVVPQPLILNSIEGSTIVQDSTAQMEQQRVFPYQATINGDNVPLLGHGGGTILMLTSKEFDTATIEVLEEHNGKARVICHGCSPSHPYQAGWISMDYIQSNN